MKLGIAISLYDKFDELAILHDIFRHNFRNKYFLYVCSNHPNAEEEILKRGLIFDGYIQGEDIVYNNTLSKEEKLISIVCRSTSTVQKSCLLAMSNTDYVMHVHCDAWPLDEQKLIEHFNSIINTKYSVAFRGLGFGMYRSDTPLGHVDDHFFILNSKKVKEKELFNFNALEMLPHKLTVHGILSANLLTKIGISNILFFDTFITNDNHICWENEVKIFPGFPVKPSLVDKNRQFIHIHTESFPGNYGKQLQSYYLIKNSLDKGSHIVRYLKSNSPDKNLLIVLTNILREKELKLKQYGYDINIFAQDINFIQNTLDNTTIKKIILNYIIKIIQYGFSLLSLRVTKKDKKIWPKKINYFYSSIIKNRIFKDKGMLWYKDL